MEITIKIRGPVLGIFDRDGVCVEDMAFEVCVEENDCALYRDFDANTFTFEKDILLALDEFFATDWNEAEEDDEEEIATE